MSTEYVQFTLDGAMKQTRIEELWKEYQGFQDNPFYDPSCDRLGSELWFVDDKEFTTMIEVKEYLENETEKYGPVLAINFGGKWIFGAKVDS